MKGITLIGMPGSGKTTVASFLATLLRLELLDIDTIMAEQEQASVSDIITKKGAAYALNLQTAIIRSKDLTSAIVSSPGSVVYCDLKNKLRHETVVMYLDTPIDVLVERINKDSGNMRTIIGSEETDLPALYKTRAPKYSEWAHFTISCGNKSPSAIAEEIVELYQKEIA